MLTVKDFLNELTAAEQQALAEAIGSGLQDARMAAQCLTAPGPQTETVVQLLAYLSEAIRQLELARDRVQLRA